MNKLIHFILCHFGIHDPYLRQHSGQWDRYGCYYCPADKWVNRYSGKMRDRYTGEIKDE
jgi:hypothetical protein